MAPSYKGETCIVGTQAPTTFVGAIHDRERQQRRKAPHPPPNNPQNVPNLTAQTNSPGKIDPMPRLAPILLATLLATTAQADEGYTLGLDLQADDADGFAATAFAILQVGEDTSISGALGRSTAGVSQASDPESIYADLGIDHSFGLLGVRLNASYWGDSDVLDSKDLTASVYLSGDRGSVGLEYEDRSLEFQLPPLDFFYRTSFPFDATGWGLNARFDVSDTVTLYASGKDYDYSVAFLQEPSDRIQPLIVISRLSVLSSLSDWRISGGITVEVGDKELGLDVSKWEGAITGSSNDSVTASFLTPLSRRVDLEISLGADRSELFGDATIMGLRFFYYGN